MGYEPKKLEWREVDRGLWSAESCFGVYRARLFDPCNSMGHPDWWLADHADPGSIEFWCLGANNLTEQEAKDQAQSDHDRRWKEGGVEVGDRSGFLTRVHSEVKRARAKFPGPNANLAALTEEVGELAKAMLSEDLRCVHDEAMQVAAMAMRCAEEGDPTLNPYREALGLLPFRVTVKENQTEAPND